MRIKVINAMMAIVALSAVLLTWALGYHVNGPTISIWETNTLSETLVSITLFILLFAGTGGGLVFSFKLLQGLFK
ncbi:MAG: hypothetical protein Q7S52_04400 [bacterium]|nr:hypothetical protein [bacterium]